MFISTQSELDQLAERLSSERVIAVDTEFIREKSYFPRLCLIQLGCEGVTAAVDPFAVDDLEPIARLMRDKNITKVFHACSQDLEVIGHALGCIPEPVFDTQVVAAFLGHRTQLGYGALVKSYTGVNLPKSSSLTDWSRRPLDADQLEYAEDDVRYLPGIYEAMVSELLEKDRMGWVEPELEALCDPSRYGRDPMDAYAHLRHAGSLTRKQLGVAREVAAWREREAMRRDIPRRWVVSDEVIVEISRRMPSTPDKLKRVRGTEQLNNHAVGALLAAVKQGLACPESDLPTQRRRTRPAASVEPVVDLMYALVRIVSERSGVAAQLIANRDDLADFVTDPGARKLREGWRWEIAGQQLTRLLEGRVGLTVKGMRVEIL